MAAALLAAVVLGAALLAAAFAAAIACLNGLIAPYPSSRVVAAQPLRNDIHTSTCCRALIKIQGATLCTALGQQQQCLTAYQVAAITGSKQHLQCTSEGMQ